MTRAPLASAATGSASASSLALLTSRPLVLPPFWRRFVTEILIWGLLAMSSDILIGYTGHGVLWPLGLLRARHVRGGGRAAHRASRRTSGWRSLRTGGGGRVAVFVAYFSTRLREIYFGITTLVFSQIFYVIIFTWTEVTGGENGLTFSQPPLSLPGLGSVPFTPVSCTGSCWPW